MVSIFAYLGLDEEDFSWQELALCNGMDTEQFYNEYESDVFVAKSVDDLCMSCPVRSQCLKKGIENDEWGVWGGVYLTNGKTDVNKNSHKDADMWDEIEQVLRNAVH